MLVDEELGCQAAAAIRDAFLTDKGCERGVIRHKLTKVQAEVILLVRSNLKSHPYATMADSRRRPELGGCLPTYFVKPGMREPSEWIGCRVQVPDRDRNA